MKYLAVLVFSFSILFIACSSGGSEELILYPELDRMLELADDNIIEWESQYKNKLVQVKGEIADVDQDRIRIVPSSMLNIINPVNRFSSGADCIFKKDQELIARTLKSGMDIAIQGRVTKTDEFLGVNRIIFKSCEFIETDN